MCIFLYINVRMYVNNENRLCMYFLVDKGSGDVGRDSITISGRDMAGFPGQLF